MKNNTISKVLKLTHRLQPGHITLIIIANIISVTGKFVPIVFGSLILDALVAHRPFEEILRYALIMISIGAFTSLAYWGLNHIISVNGSVIGEKVDQMICEKSFVIDYDILNDVCADTHGTGNGFGGSYRDRDHHGYLCRPFYKISEQRSVGYIFTDPEIR